MFDIDLHDFIYVLDLIGTFVFAISGGQKAARKKLDYLGVFVLALATGVGGGIMRDLVLGQAPPAAFQDERYLLSCLLGGLVVIVCLKHVLKRWNRVLIADAIGLSLFAVIGSTKALTMGMGPIGSIMMGALTAAGGGAIRDLLAGEAPEVLKGGFYASAALVGGVLIVIGNHFKLDPTIWMITVIIITFVLRLWAMRSNIELAKVKIDEDLFQK